MIKCNLGGGCKQEATVLVRRNWLVGGRELSSIVACRSCADQIGSKASIDTGLFAVAPLTVESAKADVEAAQKRWSAAVNLLPEDPTPGAAGVAERKAAAKLAREYHAALAVLNALREQAA